MLGEENPVANEMLGTKVHNGVSVALRLWRNGMMVVVVRVVRDCGSGGAVMVVVVVLIVLMV